MKNVGLGHIQTNWCRGDRRAYKCTADRHSAASEKHVTRCHGNGVYFSTLFGWNDVFVVEEFNRKTIMFWTTLLTSLQRGQSNSNGEWKWSECFLRILCMSS